jgi:hypothetical protein
MLKKVKFIVFVGLLSCFAADGMLRTESGSFGWGKLRRTKGAQIFPGDTMGLRPVDTSGLSFQTGRFKVTNFRAIASEEEEDYVKDEFASAAFGPSSGDVRLDSNKHGVDVGECKQLLCFRAPSAGKSRRLSESEREKREQFDRETLETRQILYKATLFERQRFELLKEIGHGRSPIDFIKLINAAKRISPIVCALNFLDAPRENVEKQYLYFLKVLDYHAPEESAL